MAPYRDTLVYLSRRPKVRETFPVVSHCNQLQASTDGMAMSQRTGVGSYRVAVANRFFSAFGNTILIVPRTRTDVRHVCC